jgi:hypothetical protein
LLERLLSLREGDRRQSLETLGEDLGEAFGGAVSLSVLVCPFGFGRGHIDVGDTLNQCVEHITQHLAPRARL